MTSTYATREDLEARISSTYTLPADDDELERLILRASELIDYFSLGRAEIAWNGDVEDPEVARRIAATTEAVADQIEFWLEVGPEHDVAGLQKGSSLMGGRVQIHKLPGFLGQRAKRTLVAGGLGFAGVGVL